MLSSFKAIPKKCPLLKLAITITQHCEDHVVAGVPPAPNVSRFISVAELTSLGNNSDLCESVETFMREEIRGKYEARLKDIVGPSEARSYALMLEIQLVRMVFAKSLHPSYPGGVAGKYTVEKRETLTRNWMSFLENKRMDLLGMKLKFGFDEKATEDAEVEVPVRIQTSSSFALRVLTFCSC